MVSSNHSDALRERISHLALAASGVAALLSILLFGVGMAAGNAGLTYASMAVLAFLMPASIGLMRGRNYDIFEPINLVAGAILIATTIRAFYLLLSPSSRVDFLMWETNFDAVLRNLPWIMLGVVAFCLGYLVSGVRIPLEKISLIRRFTLGRRQMWISVAVSASITIVGIALFVERWNIDLTSNLLSQSMKRYAAVYTSTGETAYATGYEPFLAKFAQFGFLILLGAVFAGMVRLRLTIIAAMIGLFLLFAMVPFLASSRSSIVIVFLTSMLMAYYFGKLKLRTVLISLSLAIVVLAGMGYLRAVNQTARDRNESYVDRVLGLGNGIDFVRTSSIMDRVPEVRDYRYGATYLSLFTAPIPRSMWPEKPDPGVGSWVTAELFGIRIQKHGYPPGMIAEAHINFGRYGIAPVMFLFGFLLRVLYESCRPLLGISFFVTMVYCVSILRIGSGAIGLSFAQSLLQMAQLTVPMIFFLWLANSAPARQVRRKLAHV